MSTSSGVPTMGEGHPELNFGANLRRLRTQRGLTQDDLASEVGMKVPQLSRLENTSSPLGFQLRTLLRLQRALGLSSVEELLGELTPSPSSLLAAREGMD